MHPSIDALTTTLSVSPYASVIHDPGLLQRVVVSIVRLARRLGHIFCNIHGAFAAGLKGVCYDLQTRTVNSLTEQIDGLRSGGLEGVVQITRLKKIRQHIQKDPFNFEGLDVATKEEPYWRLVDTKKKQLWLDCYVRRRLHNCRLFDTLVPIAAWSWKMTSR